MTNWIALVPAQCVMCFRNAAAQQAARSAVFNQGILVLLIPPFFVIGLIFFLAWQRRSKPARYNPEK